MFHSLYDTNLAAPVVNGDVGDGGSMARHLPHLSVGAALPQQDVPFQSPTGTQAEGLAVGKAVHTPVMGSHRVQHFAPGQVYDLDGAVQGARHQAQLMYVGHLLQHPGTWLLGSIMQSRACAGSLNDGRLLQPFHN